MSTTSKLQDYWENEYKNTATQFDIENPDRWIAALEKNGKIRGNVLDSGCGPGRTSFYLAELGYTTVGMDISVNAIERAQEKTVQKKSTARFFQADLCTLSGYENSFDTIIDIGCFHSLLTEDDRKKYAETLYRTGRNNGVVYLRAFSDMNMKRENFPVKRGLPAISEEQIRAAFSSDKWSVTGMTHQEIDLLVSDNQLKKAYCWFVEIKLRKE